MSPRTSTKCCYFYIFFVLWDSRVQHLFERRVALNPALGGLRDVESAINSHELDKIESAVFKL